MTSQEIIELKLSPALDECERHQYHLHKAWEEARAFFPLKQGGAELTDEQVRVLDQLLFRFGRLQDAIGTRLLPATLQLVQEWQERAPFLDKLNRAEKIGILPSVEEWQLLRELRNQTAHEYPGQPELVRENLARLLDHVPDLEAIHAQVAAWARERAHAYSGKK